MQATWLACRHCCVASQTRIKIIFSQSSSGITPCATISENARDKKTRNPGIREKGCGSHARPSALQAAPEGALSRHQHGCSWPEGYIFMEPLERAGMHVQPQKSYNSCTRRNSRVEFFNRFLQKRSDVVPARSAAQPALRLLQQNICDYCYSVLF